MANRDRYVEHVAFVKSNVGPRLGMAAARPKRRYLPIMSSSPQHRKGLKTAASRGTSSSFPISSPERKRLSAATDVADFLLPQRRGYRPCPSGIQTGQPQTPRGNGHAKRCRCHENKSVDREASSWFHGPEAAGTGNGDSSHDRGTGLIEKWSKSDPPDE